MTIQEKATALAKNDIGYGFVSGITCSLVNTTTVDGKPVYSMKFSAADLVGNLIFFAGGMIAGDAVPTLLKKKTA